MMCNGGPLVKRNRKGEGDSIRLEDSMAASTATGLGHESQRAHLPTGTLIGG